MTLANRLTMLRVVLAAAVFCALMWGGAAWREFALGLFLAAIVTDWLDGWLARRTHSESAFGKVADPIADKILVLGTLIALVRRPELDIPPWVIFLLVGRELLIGGIRVIAGAQGKVLAADRFGKWKTAFQCVAVALILATLVAADRGVARPWMLRSAGPLAMLCAALAWSSLWSYYVQYRSMLEKSWS